MGALRKTDPDFVDLTPTVDAIKVAARGRWPEVLRQAGVPLLDERVRGDEFSCLSPLREDNHVSGFAINIEKGVWNDKTGKDKGDAIKLVERVLSLSFPKAVAALAGVVGVPMPELPGKKAKADPLTLLKLDEAKKLPVEFLREQGLADFVSPRGAAVSITYRDLSGAVVGSKGRGGKNGDGKVGHWWIDGKPVGYGWDQIGAVIKRLEPLLILEGETDVLTAWLHRLIAIGVPGVDNVIRSIGPEHVAVLNCFPSIYVAEEINTATGEPDNGGKNFPGLVGDRLRELGVTVPIKVLRLPTKDLSDLHVRSPETFAVELAEAMKAARTWDTITVDEAEPANPYPWPDPPAEAAFHGTIGAHVRLVESETEAHPAAILVCDLIAFGNCVGRGPYMMADGSSHRPNLFAALTGPTSTGRKGTAQSRSRELVVMVDEQWANDRCLSGLSSGEGLISAVRDPVVVTEQIREGGKKDGKIIGTQEVTTDFGVEDKRLLVVEPELASVLQRAGREGNTLSAVVRQAWDGGPLGTMTKNPTRATDHHISIIGHITAEEINKLLSSTDAANGFGNRFLWCCCRRVRELPFGGNVDMLQLQALAQELGSAIDFARTVKAMTWAQETRPAWAKAYSRLTAERPGLLGKMLSRAAPTVMRLAMIYALLDHRHVIDPVHLQAALAVWDYAERSAAHIFGDSLGDPTAETILAALRASPDGLSRESIMVDVFQKNTKAAEIKRALSVLRAAGMATTKKTPPAGGKGRHTEIWITGVAGKKGVTS